MACQRAFLFFSAVLLIFARSGNTSSELELTLGEVAGAMEDAERSVTYAGRSGDAFQKLTKRVRLPDALHQAGRRAEEALALFREVEQMRREFQPDYPLLYSAQGFQYCDLLPAAPERAAWRMLIAERRKPAGETRSHQPDETVIESCRDVSQRAATALEVVLNGSRNLLDIALNHLTLGRVTLYEAILGNAQGGTRSAEWDTARRELDDAVDGLRRAGQQQYLPLGLLTRAWLRCLDDQTTGLASAREDLDEAWDIAERGPMPLFLADIHLHRARLFFRASPSPWAPG